MKRTFKKEIVRGATHCLNCGLIDEKCICDYSIELDSKLRFILLTHENEFSKRTNTGRLLEKALDDTMVVKWSRVEPSKVLLDIIEKEEVYLLYPESESVINCDEDRENKSEKEYLNNSNSTGEKINIIIIDGTWQESVKIYNRSPYLHNIKRISLESLSGSNYKLRRKKESNQLCTVEAAIEVLKIYKEEVNASLLLDYFNEFQKRYR